MEQSLLHTLGTNNYKKAVALMGGKKVASDKEYALRENDERSLLLLYAGTSTQIHVGLQSESPMSAILHKMIAIKGRTGEINLFGEKYSYDIPVPQISLTGGFGMYMMRDAYIAQVHDVIASKLIRKGIETDIKDLKKSIPEQHADLFADMSKVFSTIGTYDITPYIEKKMIGLPKPCDASLYRSFEHFDPAQFTQHLDSLLSAYDNFNRFTQLHPLARILNTGKALDTLMIDVENARAETSLDRLLTRIDGLPVAADERSALLITDDDTETEIWAFPDGKEPKIMDHIQLQISDLSFSQNDLQRFGRYLVQEHPDEIDEKTEQKLNDLLVVSEFINIKEETEPLDTIISTYTQMKGRLLQKRHEFGEILDTIGPVEQEEDDDEEQ